MSTCLDKHLRDTKHPIDLSSWFCMSEFFVKVNRLTAGGVEHRVCGWNTVTQPGGRHPYTQSSIVVSNVDIVSDQTVHKSIENQTLKHQNKTLSIWFTYIKPIYLCAVKLINLLTSTYHLKVYHDQIVCRRPEILAKKILGIHNILLRNIV